MVRTSRLPLCRSHTVQAFRALIEFLVAIGIIVAVVSNYLIINKLWKRRAVADVADSISVGAALLGLATSIPFLILFVLIDYSPAGAAKTAIGIITGVVFVLVGSGVWVAELRERGFLALFVRALRVERQESADLIKQLVQPAGADRILAVLYQLAAVDGHIDEGELALIRNFAQQWRMPVPQATDHEDIDLLTLRQSMADYLAVHPPRQQAAQVLDLLQLLAQADTRVSWQESLALDEIGGMIRHYLAGGAADTPSFEVLIVPQSAAQVDAVRTLLPDSVEKVVRGGRVFAVGRYHSSHYAEMVCQKYIALGLFTTRVGDEPAETSPPSARPVPV
jgi:hypothetical protein